MRRRLVLFLPGFDPQPPRRYRELCRREGQLQAAIAGYGFRMEPGDGPAAWRTVWQDDRHEVTSRVEVLAWDDLVRPILARRGAGGLRAMARVLGAYGLSGAVWRLARLRPQPVLVALYPFAVHLLRIVALVLIVRLVWVAFGLWVAVGLGWACAAAGAVLWRRLDRELYVSYLLEDMAFWSSAHGGWPPALAERLDRFTARARRLMAEEPWDEVLILGHSSGAGLAVSLAARLADQPGPPALLTLGQSLPMLTVLPCAGALRRDLERVAKGGLPWVDVTAPGDPCCFALTDPVAFAGIAASGPRIVSAAFSRSLSPERRARLRWRFFRRHHQYLCAFDDPQHFDFYRTTAGPLPLAASFAGRRNSPGVRP